MTRAKSFYFPTIFGLVACLGSFVAFRSHPQGEAAQQKANVADQPTAGLQNQEPNQDSGADDAYLEAIALLTSPDASQAMPKVRALLAPYSAAGDPRALNVMGLTYDPLWRLSRDTSAAEAAQFYQSSASLGYDAARHNLERLISRGLVPTGLFHPTASRQQSNDGTPKPNTVTPLSLTAGTPSVSLPQSNNSHASLRSDASSIFARVGPAVVELRSQENYGSGVILGFLRSKESGLVLEGAGFAEPVGLNRARGSAAALDLLPRDASHLLIVTNAHVVQNSRSLRVGIGIRGEGESRQHVTATAICLSQNAQEDLAFVLVRETALEEDTLASIGYLRLYQEDNPPPKGALIYALGNPEGLTRTITQGLYNGLRPEGIQFDAPISVGSSGGALVDERANLLGITSGFVASRDSQNLNFALPAARILQNLALSQSACRPL